MLPQKLTLKAFMIVIGNEKGGSGKSTTAMHIIISLLRMGFSVGSIDLDIRQKTLTHYFNNRKKQLVNHPNLPMSHHEVVSSSLNNNRQEANKEEEISLHHTLTRLANYDFIVIDTPGSDSNLSRLSHAFANVLITPINDSFIDIDLLVKVDGSTYNIEKPSCYSEMVFEQRKKKLLYYKQNIKWFVLRNRLSHIEANNKKSVGQVLNKISSTQGFKVIPGLGERVIYRELFVKGLTLLDLRDEKINMVVKVSHVSARAEIRTLLKAINLPMVNDRLSLL